MVLLALSVPFAAANAAEEGSFPYLPENNNTATAQTTQAVETAQVIEHVEPADQGIALPSLEEVKNVSDYYFNAPADAKPIIIEAKLCQTVPTKGVNQNSCVNEIVDNTLRQKQAVYLWFSTMLPHKSKKKQIDVQIKMDDFVVETKRLFVSGSIRYRNYFKFRPTDVGNYKIDFYYNRKAIHSIDMSVK